MLAAAGVPESDVRFRYGVDARYAGQGNEITICGSARARQWPVDDETMREQFDTEYRRIYGLTIPDIGSRS